jgi:hypothetical protein
MVFREQKNILLTSKKLEKLSLDKFKKNELENVIMNKVFGGLAYPTTKHKPTLHTDSTGGGEHYICDHSKDNS